MESHNHNPNVVLDIRIHHEFITMMSTSGFLTNSSKSETTRFFHTGVTNIIETDTRTNQSANLMNERRDERNAIKLRRNVQK
jgi:hypothetical protein